MESNAIVIGSGIAGLCTAARLSAEGYKVKLFEANGYAGGKVTTVEGAGYRFDAGPSLFTLPQLLDDTFKACGKTPDSYYTYNKWPTACHYFWEDGTQLNAYGDREKFANEVEEKLGVSAHTTVQYLDNAKEVYQATTPLFLEKSLHKLSTYLGKDVLRAFKSLGKLHLNSSLHDLNTKKLVHPKLVQLFDRFATYNGSSPYLTPGVMATISHLEHNLGTYYPKGGIHQITKSLVQLCKDVGVDFYFNERVEEIIYEGDKVEGVRTTRNTHHSNIVVSNMDVVPSYRELLPAAQAPEKTLEQPRSSSALIFYWGISRVFKELDLHNILFSNDYKGEFERIFKDGEVIDDPTVYINISSKVEATDAPENAENWFVMVNVPCDNGQDWEALIERTRRNVIEKINRNLSCNIEDHIAFEELLTPKLIEQKTSSYKGALYGASSNNKMAAFLRHPNFSSKIKGLYFCGGSVHPGGGMPLCMLSGKIVAELISKHG